MFRILPTFGGDWRSVAEVVNGIMNGKTNNTGEIILTQLATETELIDSRIGANSVILLMPLNARAAQEYGHGDVYISARGKGTATIMHGNHPYDMIYGYAVIG